MTTRRSLPPLLAALLALMLLGAAPSSARIAQVDQTVAAALASAPNPSKDYVRLPRRCAAGKDGIPLEPVVCTVNVFQKDRPTIVVWGDSHAWMFIPALKKAIARKSINLVAIVLGGCPPMDLDLTRAESKASGSCIRSNEYGLAVTKRLRRGDQPLRVVIGAQWQRYLHALRIHDEVSYAGIQAKRFRTATPRLFHTLGRRDIDVDVVGQVATVPVERRHCAKGETPYVCNVPRGDALDEYWRTRSWLVDKMTPLPGPAGPINVNKSLCNDRVCHGKIDGMYTWFDDLHLSATTSRTLFGYFARTVEALRPTSSARTCQQVFC